jgi:hypothetical protein
MRTFICMAAVAAALAAAGYASANAFFSAPAPGDYCYGYAICK